MTRAKAGPRDVLFYDGSCGMCRRTTSFLRAIDWLGRLSFQDMTTLADADLPVPRDAALQGIPMCTRDGRPMVGFTAVRRAALQTPLGALPALLLYLPGISHLGAAVYRWVARHRRRPGACDIRQA